LPPSINRFRNTVAEHHPGTTERCATQVETVARTIIPTLAKACIPTLAKACIPTLAKA
jgi:hypothetical protein